MPDTILIIYTGQGAAGPMARFAFYSSDFDSCAPVVLFNATTKLGGLFHMPGRLGRKPLPSTHTDVLLALVDHVKPSHVWLFDPGTPYTRYSESKDMTVAATDVKALRAVIQSWTDLGQQGEAPVFQTLPGLPNILVMLQDGAATPTLGKAYVSCLSLPTWNAHPKGDLGKTDPPDGCLFVPGPFDPGLWQNVG